MAITVKLVTPQGTEIDIAKDTADYRRLIEKLMIGGLPDMRVSSAGYAQRAGDYLYDITPAGRVIDLPITVLGKTEEQAMAALAELYAGSSFTPSQPMVLRVSNGTRTADLPCYIVGDTWAESQAGVTRVALRLYAPDPYWEAASSTQLGLEASHTELNWYNAVFLPSIGWTMDAIRGYSGPGIVRCALAQGGDLYIGGDFTEVIQYPAHYVACLSASGSLSLGLGTNGSVYAMTFGPDGKLYVGGSFTQVGINPQTSNKLAAWDGANWTRFTGACDGTIYALASDGTFLYIGGNFTTINGQPSQRFARYRPSDGTWTYYPNGFNGAVLALATGSGYVAIGGQFTAFSATTTRYAALLNTSTGQVSELGGGLDGQVNAISVVGDTIIAGGSFTHRSDTQSCYRLGYCTLSTLFQTYANWSGDPVLSIFPLPAGNGILIGTSSPDYGRPYLIEDGSKTFALPVEFYHSQSQVDIPCVAYNAGRLVIGSGTYSSAVFPGTPTTARIESIDGTKITVNFSGSATLEAVGNVTTGTLAILQYTGQAGEVLTIDLATGAVSSNLRDANAAGKFSSSFPLTGLKLTIGENKIFVKISGSGATATLYAGMKYLTLAEALNG